MNTKITITLNGRIAPEQRIFLGHKFENVGDTLTFKIPEKYINYNHYLAFQRVATEEEREDEITLPTYLLPINKVDGELVFTISNAITREPGDYKLIFLSTEFEVVDGNINEAHQVFISREFEGYVVDNFLTDPINDEPLDPALKVVYDDLLNLYKTLTAKDEADFWRGDYFKPTVDEYGYITWERKEGTAEGEPLPEGQNITGPQGVQGPYYKPSFDTESGKISWSGEGVQDGTIEEIPDIDLTPMIVTASNTYLDENLKPTVDKSVDAKFKYTWNPETQILYIETEDLETIPENADLEGVKF